jgi:glycosyltransferase involved in cell wall biosynthesis
MHVVHVTDSLHQRTGGPAASVTQLALAVARSGRATARIITTETGRWGAPVQVDPLVPVDRVPTPAWSLGCGLRLFQTIRQAAQRPDTVFHLHLMWRGHLVAAAHFARRAGRPYVVSPRGTLEPWCLEHRGGRKRLFWNLLERRRLERAAVLHATSAMEAENLARLLPDRPVAVVPNGLELPELPPRPPAGPLRSALFLSRIHPKKGLPLLLEAWAHVRPPGWRLVVVGPDEGNHTGECRVLAAALGLAKDVEFRGPVVGEARWALYRAADLFVLPTQSENFGIVVAEALACEAPVLTTTAAPWEELLSHRCGWWVPATADTLAAALRDATAAPPDTLHEMGRRGRQLIADRYSLETAAANMLDVYAWTLHGGPVPGCVRLP